MAEAVARFRSPLGRLYQKWGRRSRTSVRPFRESRGDKFGAVFEGKLCVLRAEAAGDALHEDLCVFVNENGHRSVF